VSGENSEAEIKERILARPSPQHLIPLLKKLPICLVVEDYHYLLEEVKEIVFQQWKSFVDEEVSVVVLGTTHHAIDIVSANNDLLARVCHIEMSRWQNDDLELIVKKGFDYLDIPIGFSAKKFIGSESVGLPILTQQCCEQLFIDKGCTEYERTPELNFTLVDAQRSLANVARSRYSQLESYYTRLITGPRKRARTYDTYELILSCFAQEPLKFSLRRHEIDERLLSIDLPSAKRPPAGSVTSTLNALGRFQSRVGLELLEWQAEEDTLHIFEPLFLFYLRWRGFQQMEERSRKDVPRTFAWPKLEDILLTKWTNLTFHDTVQLSLFEMSARQIEIQTKLFEELFSKYGSNSTQPKMKSGDGKDE
jgi:hypothetical protein